MSTAQLAIDLGASSGRAIVGVLDGDPPRLQLEEVHRFGHHSCLTPTGPIWDLTGIWQNVLSGLRAASKWCAEHNARLQSIGVDTWGVDYVLLGKSGELLSQSHCYRDPRNEVACRQVLEKLGGFERLYRRTGIQLLPINTLFQLAAQYQAEPRLFDAADRLLFLPDLLHYWLSGTVATELTIASTSAMLSVDDANWDIELLGELGLPIHVLGEIVQPGTALGVLRSELAEATGAPTDVQVTTPASHDTASAIAAVPATEDGSWAYLSSGTWSLLGAELDAPLANEQSRAVPFTNELGVGGTVRFLKNIAGLWPVQELRRELTAGGTERSFAELTAAAERAEASDTVIDPNHPDLAQPGMMSEKIRRLAQKAGRPEPQNEGEIVRCYLESLAKSYRDTLDQLEAVLGRSLNTLYVVGGGIQNGLLNRLTTEAVGRPNVLGPVEATAIGNLLVQAMGCGAVRSLSDAREIVARSFPPHVEQVSPLV